jgi:hypothetical protein
MNIDGIRGYSSYYFTPFMVFTYFRNVILGGLNGKEALPDFLDLWYPLIVTSTISHYLGNCLAYDRNKFTIPYKRSAKL